MMGKAKNKLLIARLKYQAVKLRANYQIPLKLYLLIAALDDKCSEKRIKYLVLASENFLRVRGFYKKYRDQEKIINEQITQDWQSL